jgi:hypothetical protein
VSKENNSSPLCSGRRLRRNIERGKRWSMIHYITRTRRRLIERAEDWEWSSAQWYAGHSPVHLQMDRTFPNFDQSIE